MLFFSFIQFHNTDLGRQRRSSSAPNIVCNNTALEHGDQDTRVRKFGGEYSEDGR